MENYCFLNKKPCTEKYFIQRIESESDSQSKKKQMREKTRQIRENESKSKNRALCEKQIEKLEKSEIKEYPSCTQYIFSYFSTLF